MEENNLRKRICAVNFDFSADNLRAYYPNRSITQAYDDVKRFLTSNGFEHRQGSGYISVVALSGSEFNRIISRMFANYPWMLKTLKTADVTIVEDEFDLLEKYRQQKETPALTIAESRDIGAKDSKEQIFDLLQDAVSQKSETRDWTRQQSEEIELER